MKQRRQPDFEFQVIAGTLKGRVIKSPDLGITRPPLTRLRKAIFDFLKPYLEGSSYLDLFSGTGSYLFEAVSRGAAKAYGTELEPKLVDAISRQAEKYGVSDKLTCLCGDVFNLIPQLGRQSLSFDVIMIAPPQYRGIIDRTLVLLAEYSLLNDDGIIICQHDTSETTRINFGGFAIDQQRKYGNTTFTVLTGK